MGFAFEVTRQMLDDATRSGLTLSAFLEREDPTSNLPAHEQTMDAFQRQLARYDIRTQSVPDAGIVADRWERFYTADENGTVENRSSLVGEWLNREYRRNSAMNFRGPIVRGNLSTNGRWEDGGKRAPNDAPLSFTLYPPAVLDQMRFQQIQPSALPYLIARTRYIDAETFYALYLSDTSAEAAARLARTAEFQEISRVRFVTAEQAIRVKKYANGLDMSYEQMRRMNIDLISWAIAYIAAKADRDKEDTAIDVIVNGDGNSQSAATSINGSTLDSGAASKLTLRMFSNFQYQWRRPYRVNTIIAPYASLTEAFLLSAGSANLAPGTILAQNMQSLAKIIPVRTTFEGLIAVDNATVASNTIVGIDSQNTLEMVLEAGSQIVQTTQVMTAQYNIITFSENVGFAIAIRGQNKSLAYTA